MNGNVRSVQQLDDALKGVEKTLQTYKTVLWCLGGFGGVVTIVFGIVVFASICSMSSHPSGSA